MEMARQEAGTHEVSRTSDMDEGTGWCREPSQGTMDEMEAIMKNLIKSFVLSMLLAPLIVQASEKIVLRAGGFPPPHSLPVISMTGIWCALVEDSCRPSCPISVLVGVSIAKGSARRP